MPRLVASRCQVGDIVLFYGFNRVGTAQGLVKGLKVLTALPALISATQGGASAFQGAADCNHAAIVTACAQHDFNIAHATSAGIVAVDLDNYLLGVTGSCKVFRMNTRHDFPREAGQVGATWATRTDNTGHDGMPYGSLKAFLSAFGSSSFGPDARHRAAFYRANRDREGGPQDFKNMHQGRAKAMFCSMFVIACYQAVMSDMYCEQMLALDAKHTSPMYLDGYLKGSQYWDEVNAEG